MAPTSKTAPLLVGLALVAIALWLRWPTFGFSLWNVDEAIHAAAARTLLDGGVLYRDAVDQRTPISYYAVAAVFAIAGENNLWAVRCFIALLVAATAFLLYLCGRQLRGSGAGLVAAALYVFSSVAVLYQGDANAANTEWFMAFFSSAAAALYLRAGPVTSRRLFGTGLLLGCAFLSKQPALLELAVPLVALAYAGGQAAPTDRRAWRRFAIVAAGWLTPVLAIALYFAVRGALKDAIFYAWTYNLTYYGPEVTALDRAGTLAVPFLLIGRVQPLLLAVWVAGAGVIGHRLLQRQPTPLEAATNPGRALLAAWTLVALAGAASGGRGFDHYSIQFLAPFCLGSGVAVAAVARRSWTSAALVTRTGAFLLLGLIGWQAVTSALAARGRTLGPDPSMRVCAYIQAHSAPADRIFVWGYHPDIYLYADRRAASRYLYASFLTGLIPWTNAAPDRDTSYAVVPGAMDQLLQDFEKTPPAFIVDCSAGPNRFWQKYPLENFPALNAYIRRFYRPVESHVFVPQGFRLFQRLRPGESGEPTGGLLPDELASTLKLNTGAPALVPLRASAPHGAGASMVDGRLQLFAHAPSSIVYRVPAGASSLRGGFGIFPGAYAPDNKGPTDGAEFVIRWRPDGGKETVLFRRLLKPREEAADRPVQSFEVSLPAHRGGELELVTSPGPVDDAASDWTFWTGLLLENSR